MPPNEINIARDYSPTPGSRLEREGEWSGEIFRNNILHPKLMKAQSEGNKLIVILDGTAGYGTSFLEEAFGGLIRVHKMNYNELKSTLEIISEEEDYLVSDIQEYIKDAWDKIKK